MFWLLHAIDDGLLRIKYVTADGKEIDLGREGELAGWYMGSDGWRAMYSKERFVDDFADLKDPSITLGDESPDPDEE
jgi:hypothetical protein